MADSFTSARLIYRAASREDEEFLKTIMSDPEAQRNGSPYLAHPPTRANAEQYFTYVAERALLGVIICLDPKYIPKTNGNGDNDNDNDSNKTTSPTPVPIGTLTLRAPEPRFQHHRSTFLGISLARAYHGQGYGTEAIEWGLEWAFDLAGMHRVELEVLGWNPGALRLYERIGFVREGCRRESLYFRSKWWDTISLAMLEDEWRSRRGVVEDDGLVGVERKVIDLES